MNTWEQYDLWCEGYYKELEILNKTIEIDE